MLDHCSQTPSSSRRTRGVTRQATPPRNIAARLSFKLALLLSVLALIAAAAGERPMFKVPGASKSMRGR